MSPRLPVPARYFAPRRGRYEVAPGLCRLGTDLGNGAVDSLVFQIDREFQRYRANKLVCRAERLSKYVCSSGEESGIRPGLIARAIAERLASEHPGLFTLERDPGSGFRLTCSLTGERLRFDAGMAFEDAAGDATIAPPYADWFDALSCQVQEDLVVVALPEDAEDFNALLHVCAPSRWAPEEKVGRSFVATHAPVPGFEDVGRASRTLLNAVLRGEPVIRFNWGVECTDRLNLHPEIPRGADPREWDRANGTAWDSSSPRPVYLRIERQALWGVPAASALVFAIRVHVRHVGALTVEERRLLASALRSMNPEAAAYRGLDGAARHSLADWLAQH